MKNGFFYEPNCVENGEWIPEKKTLEDTLVLDLRFLWNHRYNLERRYSQQYLRSNTARWRFKKNQRGDRKRLIRDIRAYRSNKEFAAAIHQSLESWYLQNYKKRMDIAGIVKWLLTTSWANDPSLFRNAKTWERDLQAASEKLWVNLILWKRLMEDALLKTLETKLYETLVAGERNGRRSLTQK